MEGDLMSNPNVENLTDDPVVHTTPLFWDCECELNYIHPASEQVCPVCRMNQSEQPDSRITEVLALDLSEPLKVRLLAEYEHNHSKLEEPGTMVPPPNNYVEDGMVEISLGGNNEYLITENAHVLIDEKGRVWLRTPWTAGQLRMSE
jgi:hypothetical protein